MERRLLGMVGVQKQGIVGTRLGPTGRPRNGIQALEENVGTVAESQATEGVQFQTVVVFIVVIVGEDGGCRTKVSAVSASR